MTPFKLALVIIFNILSQAWCAEILSKTKSDPDHLYNTIVVGLGASGLGALSKLARRGVDVLGLEASDRIGGRVFTKSLDDGVVELGAEWIHGRNTSITYDLAVANNVSVLNQPSGRYFCSSGGSKIDQDLMNDLIDGCLGYDPPQDIEPQPLGEYRMKSCNEYISKNKPKLLEDQDFIKELYLFMDVYTSSEDASSTWNEVTTKSESEYFDEFIFTSWHKYGYKTLFDILLNRYNNGPGLKNARIELKKEVTQISVTQDPKEDIVIVTKCKDGSEYKSKHVIVTLSLGVLKARYNTLFSPSLPKVNQDAIQGISMGLLNKVVMFFDEIWWQKDIMVYGFVWKSEDRKSIPKEEQWITTIPGVSTSMGNKNVLVAWLVGDSAKHMETLPEEDVKKHMIHLLHIFMGENIPEPTHIIRTSWFTNPLTLGSYSYDNLDTPLHPKIRESLGTPVSDSANIPRILFAGEATNTKHFGTVHGALESGIREANRLLNETANEI